MKSVEKPKNIVVFFTDDHAQWALGCYGNSEIHSPSLDYLAATGARMENGYCSTPVCSPGRAAMLTGRISSQHGMHDYLSSSDEHDKIDALPWLEKETLLSEIVREAGYQTGFFGKWHLGQEASHYRGFDQCFTIGPGYPLIHAERHNFYRNGQPVSLKGHKAQIITDEAIDYLRSVDDEKPFFMYVAHYETHSDWNNHPERLVNQCRSNTFADIPEGESYEFGEPNLESANPSWNNRQETLAQYYASVAQIDESVGRVMDELEAMDQLDNTLIIYASDHGLNCSHHNIWGKGNGTFPLNMLEESVRIPMLLRCPSVIEPGVVRREFADQTDLFQTCLDFAGIDGTQYAKHENYYPGKSLMPMIRSGEQEEASDDYAPVQTGTNLGTDLSRQTPTPYRQNWKKTQFGEYGMIRMARNDRYKLVKRNGSLGVDQLFDLKKDPRETINLINHPDYQSIISNLSGEIDAYFNKYEDKTNSGLNVLNLQQHNWTEAWRFRRFREEL